MQVGVEQNRLVLPLVVHSPAFRRVLWHHCGPGRGGRGAGTGAGAGAGTGAGTGTGRGGRRTGGGA